MQSGDLGRYLLFDEGAIRRLAADRTSLPVGALLVLMAVVARQHDERDLLQEPQVWLTGLGLSCAVAIILYATMRVLFRGRWGTSPEFRVLLAMVWLTAPLAWLYAIPIERWVDPVAAAKANVALLAVVALWRAALMMRVAAVLTGTGGVVAFEAVCAPSIFLFALALLNMPGETIGFMSGSRLEPDQVFTAWVKTLGGPLTLCISVSLGLELLRVAVSQGGIPARVEGFRAVAWQGPPCVFLFASLLGWGAVLSCSLPDVRRAHLANEALASNDLETVKSVLASMPREDWPPRVKVYPDAQAPGVLVDLTRLLDTGSLDALPEDHWYRADALSILARSGLVYRRTATVPPEKGAQDALALARALTRSPAGKAWLAAHPAVNFRFANDPDGRAAAILGRPIR